MNKEKASMKVDEFASRALDRGEFGDLKQPQVVGCRTAYIVHVRGGQTEVDKRLIENPITIGIVIHTYACPFL